MSTRRRHLPSCDLRPSPDPRSRTALVAGLLLLCSACGRPGRADTGEAWVSRDSAGVEILTSDAPRWGSGDGWSASSRPILVIGDVNGADPYLLDGVVGAHRTEDGRILVCNRADRTIRSYSRAGSFLSSAAGEGGGPSELRLMNRCFWRNGETWVYQAPTLPVKVYDAEGSFLRSVALPRVDGRPTTLRDVLDGRLLVWQEDRRGTLPQGVSTLHGTLMEFATTTQRIDTVGRFPSGRWVRQGRLAFPAAFSPRLEVAVGRSQLVASWPEHFDVAMLADSGVVRRLRWTREQVPVGAKLRSDFQDRILTGPMPVGDVPYGATDVRRQIADMMVYPATLPAHYRLLADRTAHLWFQRADEPLDPFPQLVESPPDTTTWDVFAPEGGWLGPVTLPAGFDPLDIGDTWILGVHRDEMGVEQIRLYGLTKPRAGAEDRR